MHAARGTAALADAVQQRQMPVIDRLLSAKADPNIAQPDGTTALHWSIYWGDGTLARRLIAAGAKVAVANRYGESPLSLAAANADVALVRLLLDAGGDVETTAGEGETLLMTGARKGSLPVVEELLSRGAAVNPREGWHAQTALMWAAAENHVEIVKRLIAAGAEVNTVADEGFTALQYAARNGAHAAGRLLLAAGADVTQATEGGFTPLMMATTNASYDLAAAIVEWGGEVDDNRLGYTPLHQLVWTYHPPYAFHPPGPALKGKPSSLSALDLARAMLEYGADPNSPQTKRHPVGYKLGQLAEFEGITPLMLAFRFQDLPLARLMLQHGGDASRTTRNGTNLLMVAAGITAFMGEMPAFAPGSYLEGLRLAHETCRCDIDAQNGHGWTAFHAAIHREGNEGLRWLVSKGARLDVKTNEEDVAFPGKGAGKTPLRLSQGQFVAMSYKYFCDQQPIVRELMGLEPTKECVRIPPYESEPIRGALDERVTKPGPRQDPKR
jgi:ankyrin repeat protein